MYISRRHILHDGIKISVLTLLSFSVFYFVLAQSLTYDLPQPCVDQGITDPEKCEQFLSQLDSSETLVQEEDPVIDSTIDQHYDLPQPCLDRGITDPLQCERLMQELQQMKLEQEADSSGPGDSTFTDTTIDQHYDLPQPCLDRGITDPLQCERLMQEFLSDRQEDFTAGGFDDSFSRGFDEGFDDGGYYDDGQRDEMPFECFEAGITSPEACKQHMISLMIQADSFEGMPSTMVIECRVRGIRDIEECRRLLESFDTQTEEFVGAKPILARECASAGITDPFECSGFMFQKRELRLVSGELPMFMMPFECQEADIREPEACKRHIESLFGEGGFDGLEHGIGGPIFDPASYMPPPCQEAGIREPQDCAKHMKGIFGDLEPGDRSEGFGEFKPEYLPRACFEAGLQTPEECEGLLRERAMPAVCKERGATTEKECESIIIERMMPPECASRGATTEKECERILVSLFMPQSCSDAGVKDKFACAEILFDKHGRPDECAGLKDIECMHLIENGLVSDDFMRRVEQDEFPASCRELGATSFEECEDLQHERLLPLECREAGVFSPEGCEKYMFEKFDAAHEARLADVLPQPCVGAGITDPRECRELMQADFFPKECAKAGITDPDDCRKMLDVSHMPEECRAEGISTKGSCEEFMRSKYMDPLCEAQGITDQVACEELVFERVSARVECEGLTQEECAFSVKKRHLGRIIEAAKRVDHVDQVLAAVAGDSGEIDLDSLALQGDDAYEDILDVFPVKGERRRKFRVLNATAYVGVSGNDEVRAAASLLLTFDEDGDGVPDDVEVRNGFDPKNPDSDGDGVPDLEEMKKRRQSVAPIDRAFMDGREIGQPFTQGEVDEELEVHNIASPAEDADTDDVLLLDGSGVPGEVVTLYIYSEIAIVLTTTVDENGQWSYALDEQLKDGAHEAYVVVNDDTGKVVRKSNPFSFIVNEARAMTIGEAAAEGILDELSSLEDVELLPEVNVDERGMVKSSMRMFAIGAVLLVVFAVMIALMIFSPRKAVKGPEVDDDPLPKD